MFIPYEKIGNIVFKLTKSDKIKDFFYQKKLSQNLAYISKNKKSVLKKLQKKQIFKVGFYVYDETKWKCQSLYDLFEKDPHFEPVILVTRSNVFDSKNPTYQSPDNVEKVYKFFRDKNMNVEKAYKNRFIPFKKFKLDIIFYQHPWYVQTSQGPVVCSKFALTYYVPYFIANISTEIEYGLRFHQYIEKHYILNSMVKDFYSKKMKNNGENLFVVGHPQLDYFYLQKQNIQNCSKNYVIYAPHWTICNQSFAYGTFDRNGEWLLKFAQNHKDLNWIFKPHPLLKHSLLNSKLMNENQINEYYNSWNEIGTTYESGDYLDLFSQSCAMITDCGSFLTEYFLTEKPLILLLSKNAAPYNPSAKTITSCYYKASNIKDLEDLINNVIINKNDFMKEQRLKLAEELNLKNNYAAQNIINDIKQELNLL